MSSAGSEYFPYSGMLGGSIPPLGCRWYFLRSVSCVKRDTKVLQEARADCSLPADRMSPLVRGGQRQGGRSLAITTRPE